MRRHCRVSRNIGEGCTHGHTADSDEPLAMILGRGTKQRLLLLCLGGGAGGVPAWMRGDVPLTGERESAASARAAVLRFFCSRRPMIKGKRAHNGTERLRHMLGRTKRLRAFSLKSREWTMSATLRYPAPLDLASPLSKVVAVGRYCNSVLSFRHLLRQGSLAGVCGSLRDASVDDAA